MQTCFTFQAFPLQALREARVPKTLGQCVATYCALTFAVFLVDLTTILSESFLKKFLALCSSCKKAAALDIIVS